MSAKTLSQLCAFQTARSARRMAGSALSTSTAPTVGHGNNAEIVIGPLL